MRFWGGHMAGRQRRGGIGQVARSVHGGTGEGTTYGNLGRRERWGESNASPNAIRKFSQTLSAAFAIYFVWLVFLLENEAVMVLKLVLPSLTQETGLATRRAFVLTLTRQKNKEHNARCMS